MGGEISFEGRVMFVNQLSLGIVPPQRDCNVADKASWLRRTVIVVRWMIYMVVDAGFASED